MKVSASFCFFVLPFSGERIGNRQVLVNKHMPTVTNPSLTGKVV